jgi:hypothetical protein
MTALFAVVVAVVGLLAYVIPGGQERRELGRIAFACGLLVTVFLFATHGVKLLP